MATDYQAVGGNAAAAFTLKVHRGERMALVAMDWRGATPPDDFVGFAIEYLPPGAAQWLTVHNRLNFDGAPNPSGLATFKTTEAPIQKFRWVVFPHDAPPPGAFAFRVTAIHMNGTGVLHPGDVQQASVDLGADTYPGAINIAFTRGYVSSQAFVATYGAAAIPTLLPGKADDGPDFVPTHPQAEQALAWMGFESRAAIFQLLDDAIADPTADVRVVAYDLNAKEIIDRLMKLAPRLRIIIDDSGSHGPGTSAESRTASKLAAAGAKVIRQHMGNLQHNKMIVVGGTVQRGVCGSTNFSWRGLYVQANNAVLLTGRDAIVPLGEAFEAYWKKDGFARGSAPDWHALPLGGVDAQVSFSPHDAARARLAEAGADIRRAQSSLLYSLAFLYQVTGAVTQAVTAVTQSDVFTYGISDRRTGITVQKPDGNLVPVYYARLTGDAPPPFQPEPSSGAGINMHHKFAVIDFDTPDARVWTGSYNFSGVADLSNGENLLLIRDRKIATAYMVEGLRLFDYYHFRIAEAEAGAKGAPLSLAKPPSLSGRDAWWKDDYTDAVKIRDRKLFAGTA